MVNSDFAIGINVYFSDLQHIIISSDMRKFLLGFILWSFCILSAPAAYSQEQEPPTEETEKKMDKRVKQAYEAYEAQEYSFAIELLKDAFTEVKSRDEKTEILFMLGESYRKINDYRSAQSYYEKAVKLGYEDPVAQLFYADMLKAQGEFEEAITAYQEYRQVNPSDARGEMGIASTKKAVEWMEDPSRYQVDNMKDLNSRDMDFSVIIAGKRDDNELIFVSSRDESTGNKEDGWTGQSFMDLYITTAERKSRGPRGRGGDTGDDVKPIDMKWSTPVPLDEEWINTKDHEGTATMDSRKKELYYTKCISDKRLKLGCTIYKSEKQGQGWSEPEQVIIGNDTSANVGHPSLSPDDNILYFVSDNFNSKGEHDIFMTTFDRRTKTWEAPQNLGFKVNTTGRELFPFAHDDGYLYFASDGHPGMGGLDIFRIKLAENGMPAADAEVENMKYPINTNWDDFHLVFMPGGDEVGYLSSNRKGSKSDDIYSVVKVPLVFRLEGVVTSSKTGRPVPQATIKLDGSDGTSIEARADDDGYYLFGEESIHKDVQYTVSFEKEKFLTNTGNVTTIGVPLSSFEFVPSESNFLKKLVLNKELDPIEEPIVLPNVFFALGKWDLRPEARNALDSVVTILSNNPTIVIELRSHTDYRDDDKSNQILSQKRADTCVSYLISKGVVNERLVAMGMGETEPFTIPENYKGYGAGQFEAGKALTESFIKSLDPEKFEVANQINRRTDFRVLRDDYVPAAGIVDESVDPKDIIADKKDKSNAPGEIYILGDRENFGTISKKFGINIVELKRLNNGLLGVRPFAGLQLKVDPEGNYEAWDATHFQINRLGMTLKDVAKAVSMKPKDLEDINPDLDESLLQPGYWVKIK